ncbi:hypothetical protein B0A55_03446 [Friedmanniomyces simplex]|uniref:JmjC domain-containing protein n=1 Tax=Friedmanniomyces simplex TaxID=329884 RepID=A0A4U0XSS8_9PEZI|nr:hypothetical protein B0A55_03446 [Friedmanniomyces simplex]
MTDPLTNLITTYHELNAAVVDELHEEPSALEFMRYVATHRPFVVRRAVSEWKACRKWDAGYLRQTMGDEEVRVAVTPSGNADAVVERKEDDTLLFVEPHEIFEPFAEFLDSVVQQSSSSSSTTAAGHVKYAQTQNDNLRNEYSPLFPDVPANIPFARIALGQKAEAINLWLGDDRSTTAMHKDNYENLYCQIRGEKEFVLLSPGEMACVNERVLGRGRYVPGSAAAAATSSSGDDGDDDDDTRMVGDLEVQLDVHAERVPVATWDPDEPEKHATAYSHLAKPLRVTLREGDMLYLPSMWYHKVSQRVGEEGFVCAVNYWYDMDFAGSHWASTSFVRDVYYAEQMRPQYPRLEVGEERAEGSE